MKLILLSALLIAMTVSAFAADGKPVSYKSGDETVNAILYTPQGKGPFPALVVIHEWWGLNDWVKDKPRSWPTRAISRWRSTSIAARWRPRPRRHTRSCAACPAIAPTATCWPRAAYLRSQKNVDPAKVGAIGWCMGGGYALDLAIADPKLKAAVINYGHLASDQATLQKIHAAILGIFGGQDKGIPPADVNKFEADLKALGKPVEIKIFPDAGHAFENPNNKQGYRADDAKQAWELTTAFLAKYLK